MLFHYNTWNHCRQGQIIVEDITKIMGYQMIALGHAVKWSNDNFTTGAGARNVVLESFADDPKTLLAMIEAHARGARFLIVATEEPTETGFNHGLEPAMIDRQNSFPAAAALCEGILHLVPGDHVTRWYSQFGKPAAYAELGYAPSLNPSTASKDDHPTNDFGFYGKMTWRRDQMLGRLERITGSKAVVIESLDVPRATRDAFMRHAKVILQIRANEEWGMVSSTRCATALSMGRPVVAEPHPYCKPWDKVVHFSETVEAFYDDAIAATKVWRPLHDEQMQRFRDTLTPEVCIGEPLRQIGIT